MSSHSSDSFPHLPTISVESLKIVIGREASPSGSDWPYSIINFAEVQVYAGQTQLSSASLTFTLSSSYYAADNCNDGNFLNFCTSGLYNDYSPTLTIDTDYQFFDKVVVYNPMHCCWDRMVGATVQVVGAGSGTIYNFWTVNTQAGTYTFVRGKTTNSYCNKMKG